MLHCIPQIWSDEVRFVEQVEYILYTTGYSTPYLRDDL